MVETDVHQVFGRHTEVATCPARWKVARRGSDMLVEESPRQRASMQTTKAGEKPKVQLHFRKHAAPVRVMVRFQESRRDRKHPQKEPWRVPSPGARLGDDNRAHR